MMLLAKKTRGPYFKNGKPSNYRRCLGPGEEHSFRSPDPVKIRICNACKKKLERKAVYFTPTCDGEY